MSTSQKPGRNDPCYCGSGKKYKKCHLPLDEKAAADARPPAPVEPEAPAESIDEGAPGFDPALLRSRDPAEIFKAVTNPRTLKRNPKLREVVRGQETLLRFLGQQHEIEAASAKLEAHTEEIDRVLREEAAVSERSEALFSEDTFAPFRFTAAEVGEVMAKMGPPPVELGSESAKFFLEALRSLATKDRRHDLSMELLMRVPQYVDQGRFVDAGLISYCSEVMMQDEDYINPFLLRMFYYGVETWELQNEEAREILWREMGAPPKGSSPDEVEAWAARQFADPAKAARLEQLTKEDPTLRRLSEATANALPANAGRLLKREGAVSRLLPLEELTPWLPMVSARMQSALEHYPPPADGAKLPEEQQQKVFSEYLLPATQEVAKALFTPERIKKLVADLKDYRRELFEAGNTEAAYDAMAAINYVEPEDDPSQNVFLINLCARAFFGHGGDEEEEEEPEEGRAD